MLSSRGAPYALRPSLSDNEGPSTLSSSSSSSSSSRGERGRFCRAAADGAEAAGGAAAAMSSAVGGGVGHGAARGGAWAGAEARGGGARGGGAGLRCGARGYRLTTSQSRHSNGVRGEPIGARARELEASRGVRRRHTERAESRAQRAGTLSPLDRL